MGAGNHERQSPPSRRRGCSCRERDSGSISQESRPDVFCRPVPNVVYSCGSLIHRDRLILPYAMSDTATAIASLSLPDLLGALVASRTPME